MSCYQDTALLKGLCCLATAEQVHELITVVAREELAIGLPKIVHARAESEVCRLARLAMHIEQNRLDRTDLPVYQGREQLMSGATALLEEDASLECQDAMPCDGWRCCSTNCCGETMVASRPSWMDSL